jgi:hypothetical protein
MLELCQMPTVLSEFGRSIMNKHLSLAITEQGTCTVVTSGLHHQLRNASAPLFFMLTQLNRYDQRAQFTV